MISTWLKIFSIVHANNASNCFRYYDCIRADGFLLVPTSHQVGPHVSPCEASWSRPWVFASIHPRVFLERGSERTWPAHQWTCWEVHPNWHPWSLTSWMFSSLALLGPRQPWVFPPAALLRRSMIFGFSLTKYPTIH